MLRARAARTRRPQHPFRHRLLEHRCVERAQALALLAVRLEASLILRVARQVGLDDGVPRVREAPQGRAAPQTLLPPAASVAAGAAERSRFFIFDPSDNV